MLWVVVGGVLSAAIGGVVYLWAERMGTVGAGLAALRATALTVLVLLLVNPARIDRVRGGPPTVLLDASLSMGTTGGHWREARDTALALAGTPARVLRFGSALASFDTMPPEDGTTQLSEALRAAAARSGPVVVVSDGGVDDAGVLSPVLTQGVTVVVLPRDPVPDAALLDVAIEGRIQRGDSVPGTFLVSTVGPLTRATGRFEVFTGQRRLLVNEITLPPSPGMARRTFLLPAGLLGAGVHVLTFRLTTSGDGEPGDDVRQRVVSVTDQPHVVVLVNPPDWEGRFLASTLAEVAHTTVRGFARVRPDRWVDMRTLAPVSAMEIRATVRTAGLVVARGDVVPELAGFHGPLWRWPAGTEAATQSMPGDWYVTPETPSSPVGGRFASVAWDSVAPVEDLVPVVVAPGDWVGLSARLGRRGADRALLVGRDTGGLRSLTTTGDGFWRWDLKGGAAREAYRAFVAGGVDWLLGADAIRRISALTASPTVPRGQPLAFRWTRTPVPDSLVVRLSGPDSSFGSVLRFDAQGVARLFAPPGTYRWSAPGVAGAVGLSVVESYSDEFRPRPVTLHPVVRADAFSIVELRPRERWWLFVIVVLALLGEWAWRLRRGLP
ncbi:MAG: hypothetical protein EXR93_10885 [Gemmatimonadetes bacterium]|nr:hypothetical protein [Gemmatimonadota bacterium]